MSAKPSPFSIAGRGETELAGRLPAQRGRWSCATGVRWRRFPHCWKMIPRSSVSRVSQARRFARWGYAS